MNSSPVEVAVSRAYCARETHPNYMNSSPVEVAFTSVDIERSYSFERTCHVLVENNDLKYPIATRKPSLFEVGNNTKRGGRIIAYVVNVCVDIVNIVLELEMLDKQARLVVALSERQLPDTLLLQATVQC